MSGGFPSEFSRKFDRILRGLGYEMDRRNGGHFIYKHPDHPFVTLASSPSDWRSRQNLVSELRRRHPDEFARHKSTRESGPGRESRERVLQRHAEEMGRPITRARAQQLIGRFGSVAAARAALRHRTEDQVPDVPAPVVNELAARRHRCGDCGRPWLKTAHRPDAACPYCGSDDVSIERPEAA